MIDSHCHLADEVFAGDIDQVLARAFEAGVTGALCIVDASSAAEVARAAALLERWPGLRTAVGIHPHQAGAWAGRAADACAGVERAIELLPGTRAVGEIGLDYHYDLAPPGVQREIFRAQVALAREGGLPVVIHGREAEREALTILQEEGRRGVRAVFHCYTGDLETATAIVDAGCCLGMGGILTFPKGENVRTVAAAVPCDALLIETDSPFLAPVPFRGRRNEPAWVARVAEALGSVRGVTRGEIDAATTRSFVDLFRP